MTTDHRVRAIAMNHGQPGWRGIRDGIDMARRMRQDGMASDVVEMDATDDRVVC